MKSELRLFQLVYIPTRALPTRPEQLPRTPDLQRKRIGLCRPNDHGVGGSVGGVQGQHKAGAGHNHMTGGKLRSRIEVVVTRDTKGHVHSQGLIA